jgi:hypothetical protein
MHNSTNLGIITNLRTTAGPAPIFVAGSEEPPRDFGSGPRAFPPLEFWKNWRTLHLAADPVIAVLCV